GYRAYIAVLRWAPAVVGTAVVGTPVAAVGDFPAGAPYLLGHRVDLHAQVAGQLPGVLRPHRVVLDLGHQRGGRTQRLHPTLDGPQFVVVDRAANRELHQRHPPGHQVAYGQVALGLPQLARIHAGGLDGHECLGDEPLLVVERPQRRLPTGLVAIEGEDD